METNPMAKSLLETFAQFPDPRSVHGKRHSLSAILTLAVAGMLSEGAQSVWHLAVGPSQEKGAMPNTPAN